MKWFGLTGGLGCGKSLVTEIIRKNGFPVVDADRIVHHLYETDKNLHQGILNAFGASVFVDGKPVRKLLAEVIKLQPNQKSVLENLIHPIVQAKVTEVRDRLKKNKARMAFYDVPLLFENNLQDNFVATIFVNAPLELIYSRLEKRNKWSKEEVDIRMSWLLPNKIKLKLATYVIENDGLISELELKVEELLRRLAHQE
jgi:dephospho-CoA kinase